MSISTLEQSKISALEDFLTFVNGEDLRPLAHDYIKAMFAPSFRKPTFIILEDGPTIIGAAAFSEEIFTVNTWGISWVSVHPEFRHQGHGQKLVNACLLEISNRITCPSTALLATYPDKTQLYERIGFQGLTRDHGGGFFLSLPIFPNKGGGS